MITLQRCGACNTACHPPRALCPVCGAVDWRPEPCATGVVEECTTVTGARPVVLASVRSASGPVMVVALPAPVPPGTEVALRPGPGRAVEGVPVPRGSRLPDPRDRS